MEDSYPDLLPLKT